MFSQFISQISGTFTRATYPNLRLYTTPHILHSTGSYNKEDINREYLIKGFENTRQECLSKDDENLTNCEVDKILDMVEDKFIVKKREIKENPYLSIDNLSFKVSYDFDNTMPTKVRVDIFNIIKFKFKYVMGKFGVSSATSDPFPSLERGGKMTGLYISLNSY